MKIKSLQLKNFKRFTDLTLQDIPDNAKLVLLIGSNGSGKSSVFDAFECMTNTVKGGTHSSSGAFYFMNYSEYYNKNKKPFHIELIDQSNINHLISQKTSVIQFTSNNFYGRTSFRQVPVLTRKVLGTTSFDIKADSDRPSTFIDRDSRFENDIEKIAGDILGEIFRTNKSSEEIRERYVNPINQALENIFGEKNGTQLRLIEVSPPLDGKIANIIFKKGESEIHYNLLSAGEKEIFNILINLVARGEYYKDTVFFFDEIDLHLNTKLQYNFLKEIIENWIPDNCQFWTASHSLGFIQYATDYENGVIIDFDDLDFDKKQALSPQPKDSLEIFEIAVSKAFIDQVVQGRKIIFSENTDTPFYNDLNIANTLFFVAIDKIDVFHKSKNLKQSGLIDRDYLSDDEVVQIKKDYPSIFLLPYYSFENLVYHPDNLEEYYKSVNKPFNKQSYIKQITGVKNNEINYLAAGIIQARGGYPFYKENENAKKLKAFKENYKGVIDLLRSDDFETFYKAFPAKDYGRDIPERIDLSVSNLAKTNWFKTQIENIIK
jgi:energy-coupling factor transporter ATP-binding protein EcfA2